MPHKLMPNYVPQDVKFSLRPDVPDERDYIFTAVKGTELPRQVSLQKYAGIAEDQGDLSSCTGEALANAYETRLKISIPAKAVELSRLFIYYNARSLEGTTSEDQGATIRSGIKALKSTGVCAESLWPSSRGPELWDDKPSDEAYAEGKQRTILTYERVVDLFAMRECLAQERPFVFGIPIYNDKAAGPDNNWTFTGGGKQLLGYHALCCVGYNDETELFLVKNSWGTSWGLFGYCYVTYDMMMKEALDAWTFDVKVVEPANTSNTAPAVVKEPWWRRFLRFFSGQ